MHCGKYQYLCRTPLRTSEKKSLAQLACIRESGQDTWSARANIQWVCILVRELISALDGRFFLRNATLPGAFSLLWLPPISLVKCLFFPHRGQGPSLCLNWLPPYKFGKVPNSWFLSFLTRKQVEGRTAFKVQIEEVPATPQIPKKERKDLKGQRKEYGSCLCSGANP